jgi:c-di-AMP phosphodiesterase-like protein
MVRDFRITFALYVKKTQKILTLFDALDEREIARKFSDARAFMAMPVSYYLL